MARRHESTKRIEDVTQAEVWAEIRYLDPDPSGAEEQDNYGVAIAIGALLAILAVWVFIHIWLCP